MTLILAFKTALITIGVAIGFILFVLGIVVNYLLYSSECPKWWQKLLGFVLTIVLLTTFIYVISNAPTVPPS